MTAFVTKPKKQPACIIWGGYAQGNTGDELCLAAALERKRKELGGDVAILSPLPELTSQLFPQAIVVPYVRPLPEPSGFQERFGHARKSLKTTSGFAYFMRNGQIDPGLEWMRALAGTGELHLAGGGYLTDLFPLEFILPPIQFALKMKVPVATAPRGIGPFTSPLNADTVATALRRIKLKVRDQTSLDFCRDRGINAILEPDDAFAWVKNFLASEPASRPPPRPRKIGVCIFTQYGQDANCDLTQWWTECLRGLKAQHPEHEIEGFCFHTSLEAEFQEMTRLFSQAGLPPRQVLSPTADFRQAVEIVRGYDLVISTRFHATVTANVFNLPNIAIAAGDYYRAKMSAATSGFESICRLINPTSVTPRDLLNLCKGKLDRAKA